MFRQQEAGSVKRWNDVQADFTGSNLRRIGVMNLANEFDRLQTALNVGNQVEVFVEANENPDAFPIFQTNEGSF